MLYPYFRCLWRTRRACRPLPTSVSVHQPHLLRQRRLVSATDIHHLVKIRAELSTEKWRICFPCDQPRQPQHQQRPPRQLPRHPRPRRVSVADKLLRRAQVALRLILGAAIRSLHTAATPPPPAPTPKVVVAVPVTAPAAPASPIPDSAYAYKRWGNLSRDGPLSKR